MPLYDENTFNQKIDQETRNGRLKPESREVLTAAHIADWDDEDREAFEPYIGQEVTLYRDMTGFICGIVTDDD